jgi:predicted GNAT family acetyltransferase
METEVRNNRERSRYELWVDGELAGVADYHLMDDAAVMPHTEVAWSHRGQGLGAVLVRAALEDLRAAGRTVIPHCWYVAQFIGEHPEFKDLVAAA